MDGVTKVESRTSASVSWWDKLTGTRKALIGWTIASLIGNVLIIVTGAFVRLTGSGLGCPTWPQCDAGSYVPQQSLGIHGAIEFGNRLLTFVLIALALGVFITAVRTRSDRFTRRLALVAGLGIPFQGVIGGITVLTDLNPFVVALHLMLSLLLVAILTRLLMHITNTRIAVVSPATWWAARATFVAMFVACWLGTVVTGSGPHSGDGGAVRTGFDIDTVARIHAVSVWATVALTLVTLVLLQRAGSAASKWAVLLLVIELAQGTIGYIQYFTGVPMVPVLFHLLGAGISVAAASALAFAVRPEGSPERQPNRPVERVAA